MALVKAKRERRLARIARTRRHQARLRATRVVVYLSEKHTYAQIISPQAKVLASASTVEKSSRAAFSATNGGNIAAAKEIGRLLAEKAQPLNIGPLGFDRGGRRYAGRVRALAEAARAGGLSF